MLLNYDFTFLAILLSRNAAPVCGTRRCVMHPCRGCAAAEETEALNRAADYSVVLSWWQLRDHIADHGFFGGLKYRLASLLLRGAYRKARELVPAFDASVERQLQILRRREEERCPSLDLAAEPFALLLSELAGAEGTSFDCRVLRQIFYHLGRWIYLVDAADDLAEDFKTGNYNPLRYRYALTEGVLTDENKADFALTLDDSINRMAAAYALLDPGPWTPVLDSVFYDSLYGIGKAVLDGTYHHSGRKVRTGA